MMLSIRVIESRNESEVVLEARQVRKFLYPNRKDGDQFIGEVVIDPVDDGQITYQIRGSAPADSSDDQRIFVMNSHGATVASYYL